MPGIDPIGDAVKHLGASGMEEKGAVFTRPEVVDFILDLVGYTENEPLDQRKILEPSFGDGEFLIPITRRLISCYTCRPNHRHRAAEDLGDCVRAVELTEAAFEDTRERLKTTLLDAGLPLSDVHFIVDRWLVHGDFLLESLSASFDYVVGNPPYVRQELIPDVLIREYRRHFSTIYDRADLYVPFIEKSLLLLAPKGSLGFICADRWTKNRYGGPLRKLVAERFHLKCYVDMTDTPAFLSEVTAYPAVTVISNEEPGPTRLAHRPPVDASSLSGLAQALRNSGHDSNVIEVSGIVSNSDPWVLEDFDSLKLVRRLEAEFPLIEQAGCKVGIGVATGADSVFIGNFEDLDVEEDRKLALARTKDIKDGKVHWQGFGVINPFDFAGNLVNLDHYPKLATYLGNHGEVLRRRHVGKSNPAAWYRTIDRIYPDLAARPKLLIPDINGTSQIVYEDGHLYPHHNLYFIVSDEWDLQALRGVLMSGIARLFVSTYSTKMRGGYLRYQAQYLRRIRLPHWKDIPLALRTALAAAAESEDLAECHRVVSELYNLSSEERKIIEQSGASPQ
jgi:hypothetical protein